MSKNFKIAVVLVAAFLLLIGLNEGVLRLVSPAVFVGVVVVTALIGFILLAVHTDAKKNSRLFSLIILLTGAGAAVLAIFVSPMLEWATLGRDVGSLLAYVTFVALVVWAVGPPWLHRLNPRRKKKTVVVEPDTTANN